MPLHLQSHLKRWPNRPLVRDFLSVASFIEQTDRLAISDEIIQALVVSEDKRFYFHPGIDPIAVGRAMWSTIVRQRLQGASTIEQQLVRTITRRYELSINRKIREMFLAAIISLHFPKVRIAQAYLRVAYFGWGMNGIHEACRHLGIDVCGASRNDAAAIIARLKYPEPQLLTPERQDKIRRRILHILALRNNLEEK